VALAAAAVSQPAFAAGDPAHGKALFENTPGTSGIASLTASCIDCHGSVQNRRAAIAGSPFAAIDFDTALTFFTQAVQNKPPMKQFQALTAQQVSDIAAYLADTPRTSPQQMGSTLPQVDFSADALDTATATHAIDLTAASATSDSLHITGVNIGGPAGGRFTRRSDLCDQQTLAPGASCRILVSFSASDANEQYAALTITARQGASTEDLTRSVLLHGTVAGATPAPSPPPTDDGMADASSEGGGALGWPWLGGLALALLALRRGRSPHA
jgi:mono/diheme cytochrome c family protein